MILDSEMCRPIRYQYPEQIETITRLYRGDCTTVSKHDIGINTVHVNVLIFYL